MNLFDFYGVEPCQFLPELFTCPPTQPAGAPWAHAWGSQPRSLLPHTYLTTLQYGVGGAVVWRKYLKGEVNARIAVVKIDVEYSSWFLLRHRSS